jgi:uncharacterized protein YciI
MEFDQVTVVLLVRSARAAGLSDAEAESSQDAHMAHLADLHEAGHLLAAGPLFDDDGHHRGLMLLRTDVETATQLMADDPAVLAGRFDVVAMPWMVPTGAMAFTPTHFPRSMGEVR